MFSMKSYLYLIFSKNQCYWNIFYEKFLFISSFYFLCLLQYIYNKMGCQISNLGNIQQNTNQMRNQVRKKKKKNVINPRISNLDNIAFFENVRKINRPKQPLNIGQLDTILSTHFLFYKLSKTQRLALIQCMEYYVCDQETYIFKQGDIASLFFIINQGRVMIEVKGVQIKKLGQKQCFGQLALLYTAPRSASIKSIRKCAFWCLSQKSFKQTIAKLMKQNYMTASSYVDRIPLFSFLTEEQKASISYNMNTLKYQKNQIIFKKDDDANSYYIILSGQIEVNIPGKTILVLKTGDSFGQNSFIEGQKRSGTAKCLTEVNCISISRQAIKQCLGGKFEQLKTLNIVKWALKRSKYFKKIPNNLMQKIIESVEYKKIKRKEIVYDKGQIIQSLVILIDTKVNSIEAGNMLFQQYIFKYQGTAQKYVAEAPGVIGILQFKILQQIFGGEKLAKVLKNQNFSNFECQDHLKIALAAAQSKANTKIQFDKLDYLRLLGQGQFGKVILVCKRSDKTEKYALKIIDKNMIEQNQIEQFIMQQKQILSQINFPLIVQLYDTNKDQRNLYFLMKYIDGGDFFSVLREIGLLSQQMARFYIACLLLCLEYLNSKNIVYRDLKPQNSVIDKDGYLYMVDLGTAKTLLAAQGFRTFTIIGTPYYMAPQIMQGKGYGFQCDIWSLGVILFQMLFGYLPYGQQLQDPYDLYKEIITNKLAFPEQLMKVNQYKKSKQLIKKMMEINPSKRKLNSFSSLKKTLFFDKFDWQGILKKKVKAPYQFNNLKQKQNAENYSLNKYLESKKPKKQTIKTIAVQQNWDEQF